MVSNVGLSAICQRLFLLFDLKTFFTRAVCVLLAIIRLRYGHDQPHVVGLSAKLRQLRAPRPQAEASGRRFDPRLSQICDTEQKVIKFLYL